MNKKQLVISIVLALVFSGFAFKSGYECYEPRVIAETIIKTVEVPSPPVVTHEIQYVEVPVEKIVYQNKEVIKTSIQPLRNFESVDEARLILGGINQWPDETWTCVDFAYTLQESLARLGYYSSVQLIQFNTGQWHVRNTIRIEDELWKIEPQTMHLWKDKVSLR